MDNIIFISPGPACGVRTGSYQKHYKCLSRRFSGYIFTTSFSAENLAIGNFNYQAIRYNDTLAARLKFIIFCIKSAVSLTRKKEVIDLVVTYDPLTTGLIAVIVSFIVNAKLVTEVNGVYTSQAIWIDSEDNIITRVKRRIYQKIMRFVLMKSDGIKLLFNNQIDPFKEITLNKIVKSFPCYVAVNEFKNIKENKEVLFVGFPLMLKGVDILIKSFKIIAPKYPDWKLKILGWYPDPEDLYSLISNHPQIFHHEPVPADDMPNHIGSCAILVLPSRSEAMGRVLVEAMAAGKPRIGSNVGGIPTVINNGVDGLLVEPEDVDDLSRKLDLLMGDQIMRHKLGKAGEIRAKKEFTEESYVNNLVDYYNEILLDK